MWYDGGKFFSEAPVRKYRKEIAIAALFALACAAMVLFGGNFFTLLADETADRLLRETLARTIAFFCILPVLPLCGCGSSLRIKGGLRGLPWCLPCLLVALCNFPFHALAAGTARVERTDLIWLFALDCLGVGLMEELLFRGLLLPVFFDLFRGRKVILPVFLDAALFGLWHLANLFYGAPVGATLMQVGYSFLIGGMLSAVFLKTGNMWTSVFLHALFNFGGLLVSTLGSGAFQDTVFWICTALAGTLCLAHVLCYLFKEDKKMKTRHGD